MASSCWTERCEELGGRSFLTRVIAAGGEHGAIRGGGTHVVAGLLPRDPQIELRFDEIGCRRQRLLEPPYRLRRALGLDEQHAQTVGRVRDGAADFDRLSIGSFGAGAIAR